jgi:hypothetical protein
VTFAPKKTRGGCRLWSAAWRKGWRRGGLVRAAPRGRRRRTGPDILAVERERRRWALVKRCLALCGSRGAGGAHGLHVRAWAGKGKEGAGPGPRATVPIFDLKGISKLNTI